MKIDNGQVFGQRSSEALENVHCDLKHIHNTAIKRCPIDYGIHEGQRTYEKQLEYFLGGKSSIDPRTGKKSKHMLDPSEATDMHVAESHLGRSLTWDRIHLAFLAGYLISVSHELYEKEEITHVLRWGGDWDGDGVLGLDQTLQDMPHLELIKP